MEEFLPKSKWGSGAWRDEPDHVKFEHKGMPCILNRAPVTGTWCGYAAVPPGHPLHGKSYNSCENIDVHGGLTYSDFCQGEICHVPKPGEPDDVWWFGFDCAHAFDLSPAMQAHLKQIPGLPTMIDDFAKYRDIKYVEKETKELAEQLLAMR